MEKTEIWPFIVLIGKHWFRPSCRKKEILIPIRNIGWKPRDLHQVKYAFHFTEQTFWDVDFLIFNFPGSMDLKIPLSLSCWLQQHDCWTQVLWSRLGTENERKGKESRAPNTPTQQKVCILKRPSDQSKQGNSWWFSLTSLLTKWVFRDRTSRGNASGSGLGKGSAANLLPEQCLKTTLCWIPVLKGNFQTIPAISSPTGSRCHTPKGRLRIGCAK